MTASPGHSAPPAGPLTYEELTGSRFSPAPADPYRAPRFVPIELPRFAGGLAIWTIGLVLVNQATYIFITRLATQANVNASDETEYKDIVQVVQGLKTGLKKVYLAG